MRSWCRRTRRRVPSSSRPSANASSWACAASSDSRGRNRLTEAGGLLPPALRDARGHNPRVGKFFVSLLQKLSMRARQRRAGVFRAAFGLDDDTRILDLGSEWGGNIHAVLDGTPVRPENTFIADINPQALERGRQSYGFVPVLVGASGKLPFPDGYFDIVYCSSVIEHVTIPKDQVWTLRSGKRFRQLSLEHQREFAREIQRVGRQFFVQTPYRWFVL